MKRIAVISDSHQAQVRVNQFIELAKKERFDEIIFCGDGLDDLRRIEREVGMSCMSVAGNCDWFSREKDTPREFAVKIAGVTLMATHGDRYDVKWQMDALSYRAEELGAQVALFGHTHKQTAGYCGNVMMVNPGALKLGYYAVLELDSGKCEPRLMRL